MKSRTFRFACAGLLAAAVLAIGLALYRANRAVRQATSETEAGATIPFRVVQIERRQTGVEPIAAPAVFADAVPFRGHLYLCGPAGLLEYDGDGAVRSRYTAGVDLPAAPKAVASGVVAGSSEPELFIATEGEGLIAFNGTTFRQIRPEPGAYRDLTAVLPLPNGRILLGTEKKGVVVWDGRTLTPFHASLTGLQVSVLAGDESNLWTGTVNNGVLHWHAGQLERFGENEGLPDPHVLSVALAGEAAYIGTPMGVAEFISGRFTRVVAPGVFAQSVLVRKGALVIGTLEQGVVTVPLAPGRPRAASNVGEVLAGKIERLFELDERLYAVSANGLYRIEERQGEWSRVLERGPAVLADRNISALAFDWHGKLWVGYFDRGLDILEPSLDRAAHIENDHIFCVNRIAHDAEPSISMVGTANGLAVFDNSAHERQVLRREQGLIANQITDILLNGDGVTVATPAGLTLFGEGGPRSLYAFHGLVNNHVYALAGGPVKTLAGTLGGLTVIENGAVKSSYTTANSALRANWITAIAPLAGDWYIGTYGGGIVKLDRDGKWQRFPDLPTNFEVNTNAMCATVHGVYAGTLRDGIYVYDRATGRWRNMRAGLPSPNVTALAEHGGYIYAGTDNGLVRFPENSR